MEVEDDWRINLLDFVKVAWVESSENVARRIRMPCLREKIRTMKWKWSEWSRREKRINSKEITFLLLTSLTIHIPNFSDQKRFSLLPGRRKGWPFVSFHPLHPEIPLVKILNFPDKLCDLQPNLKSRLVKMDSQEVNRLGGVEKSWRKM